MKILLLGFGKIAYMPYMHFYLDTLRNINNIEFELIFWDRDGKPDAQIPKQISRAYKFEAHLEEQLPFRKKLKFFYRYRKFAINVLKKTHYDKIIVLHTTPGLTLFDYLLVHYRNKYIFDFRDISYEYIFIYRKLVGILVKKSAITYVSSDAFRKFLPKLKKIYTVHNYLEDSLNHIGLCDKNCRERNILRIGFWGFVRQFDINKILMDAIGNDRRFELHYYGRMQQAGRNMEAYARSQGYSNVFFHGAYMPNQRYNFAINTDIIHNIYDLGYTTGNALGNKYYDGIIFGIPQICTSGSNMGQLVSDQGIGITVGLEETCIADKIWNYYNHIDFFEFEKKCKDIISQIVQEQFAAKKCLIEFIS